MAGSVLLHMTMTMTLSVCCRQVYGVLRYYGFTDYQETHPLVIRRTAGDRLAPPPEERVLDVRWMGRLLPVRAGRLHLTPTPRESSAAGGASDSSRLVACHGVRTRL